MQVLKSMVVMLVLLEVFPNFGFLILTAIAAHLFLGGLCGHLVDKVHGGAEVETCHIFFNVTAAASYPTFPGDPAG